MNDTNCAGTFILAYLDKTKCFANQTKSTTPNRSVWIELEIFGKQDHNNIKVISKLIMNQNQAAIKNSKWFV